MENLKRDTIEISNSWQPTKYRYITSGSNWAWGRNQVENKVFGVLFTTTLVSFFIGTAVGGWVGVKIVDLFSSYNLGYWSIMLTILLACVAGMALAIGFVQVVYRILWPLIEAARNVIDSRK